MTVGAWLREAQKRLTDAEIATARLDCLVLLEDELGHDRGWLLSHSEEEIQGSKVKKLNTKIVQRTQHTPLAYLRGHAEFYGRTFTVNEHTLVPRPETETMITLLKRIRNQEADIAAWQVERRGRTPIKKHYKFEKQEPPSELVKTNDGYKVVWTRPRRTPLTQPPAPIHGNNLRHHDEALYLVDVGTGSGAIAITAQLEIPEATVCAIDIDERCLAIAAKNAHKLGANIDCYHGNLLQPLPVPPVDKIVILLCNLPYVPDDFHINTAATHEPQHAIFGGYHHQATDDFIQHFALQASDQH
jgi:methylase of polypeptide subunit release factors